MSQNISDNDILQIEQAARGCISGKLSEWPALYHALKKCNVLLPLDTHALVLTQICKLILTIQQEKK